MKKILLIIMANTLITAGLIYGYHFFFAPKIVALDLTGYLDSLKTQYMAGKLSDEDLKKRFDALEETVKKYSKRHIVVRGDLVLGDVKILRVEER
jgi:hypothetical protein